MERNLYAGTPSLRLTSCAAQMHKRIAPIVGCERAPFNLPCSTPPLHTKSPAPPHETGSGSSTHISSPTYSCTPSIWRERCALTFPSHRIFRSSQNLVAHADDTARAARRVHGARAHTSELHDPSLGDQDVPTLDGHNEVNRVAHVLDHETTCSYTKNVGRRKWT